MKGFRKFKLGTSVAQRLNLVLAVLIAGFVLISLAFFAVDVLTIETFKKDEQVVEFATLADESLIAIAEARRDEKNFLLHKDKKYLEHFDATMDKSVELIDKLDLVANKKGEHTVLAKLKEVLKHYREEFDQMAVVQEEVGLDDNSGLLGKLNESAHTVEQDLQLDGEATLRASLFTMRLHEKNFLAKGSDQFVDKMKGEQKRFDRLLSSSAVADSVKASIRKDMKAYQDSFTKIVQGYKKVEKNIGIYEKSVAEAAPLIEKLHDFLVEHKTENTQLHKTTQVWILLGFSTTLVLVALITGIMVFRLKKTVTQSLEVLQDTVDKVAEGDFSVRVPLESKDEFGTLGNAFNAMLEERGKFMKTEEENEMLNNSIIGLVRAVSKLGRGDLNSKAPVNEDITGALGDAINAMSDNIAKTLGNVDNASQQLIQASGEVKTNTEDNKNTVLGAAKGMSELRGTIQETAKRIKRLGERSQEIGGIIKLIDNIAERTNVLALNANMHAAAAGEAGRGFMVVADEVQRLAESSKGATEQISKLVNSIQVETSDTISAMDKAIGEVVKGGEVTEQAAEQMEKTEDTVTHLEKLGQDLYSAVAAFDLPEKVVPMRPVQTVAMKAAG